MIVTALPGFAKHPGPMRIRQNNQVLSRHSVRRFWGGDVVVVMCIRLVTPPDFRDAGRLCAGYRASGYVMRARGHLVFGRIDFGLPLPI